MKTFRQTKDEKRPTTKRPTLKEILKLSRQKINSTR